MMEARAARKALGVVPAYKRVDTCAAEFQADTPYMYSCYDGDCEAEPSSARKVGRAVWLSVTQWL
jgi:carbamoyl-phosphate synthase large subunit